LSPCASSTAGSDLQAVSNYLGTFGLGAPPSANRVNELN
jgi:hypothetical protein